VGYRGGGTWRHRRRGWRLEELLRSGERLDGSVDEATTSWQLPLLVMDSAEVRRGACDKIERGGRIDGVVDVDAWRHRGCWRAGRGRTGWRRVVKLEEVGVLGVHAADDLCAERAARSSILVFGVGLERDDKLVGGWAWPVFGRSNDEPGACCLRRRKT